ncbi:MAG TPA: head GIN domain-containing protein [Tenuifilaceae bacterium]|nr:head GIN domain-containing protein [Tenuifilaceae bacterium]
MKISKFFFSLIVGVVLSSAVYAQNTDERTLTPFDELKVYGEVKVYLEKGEAEHAKVITEDIPVKDIITEIDGKTLIVKLKSNIYKNVRAEVYVTYRELREVSTSAAASISLNSTLNADKITLDINTSSEFVGEISANTGTFTVGQGATLRLNGNVKNYEAKVNTGGILSALDCKSDSTFVTVSSGGIAKVFASKLLDAKVRTGGSLTITGKPEQKKVKTFLGANVIEQ